MFIKDNRFLNWFKGNSLLRTFVFNEIIWKKYATLNFESKNAMVMLKSFI